MSDSSFFTRLKLIVTGRGVEIDTARHVVWPAHRPSRRPFVPARWRPDLVAINHLATIVENKRATFL